MIFIFHYHSQVGSSRLPPVDKLCWLVSRDQVDQELLPLPSSTPVDPDHVDNVILTGQDIRGTLTWAPPRPQIVLTIQVLTNQRSVIDPMDQSEIDNTL